MSIRARREDQQLVVSFWTSPCISNGASAAVSVLSHIALFWKQSEVGNSKMAISWKRWMNPMQGLHQNVAFVSMLVLTWKTSVPKRHYSWATCSVLRQKTMGLVNHVKDLLKLISDMLALWFFKALTGIGKRRITQLQINSIVKG